MADQRTPEDIQALKDNWYKDPIFDIEDTEGFEAHREELLRYSIESKEHWKKLKKEKYNRLCSMICPILSIGVEGYGNCKVEECAWWNSDRQCCGMLPHKEVVISGGINTHPY